MAYSLNIDNSYNRFKIDNIRYCISYEGTAYDYNQILFLNGFGGMAKWLENYLQFEEKEAKTIAQLLNIWHNEILEKEKE